MWYPGSGVVLDCIDSSSLPPFLLLLRLEAAMALLRLHGYRDSSEPLLFSGATSTKISCNGSSMQVFDENLFSFCVLVLYIPVSIFSVML